MDRRPQTADRRLKTFLLMITAIIELVLTGIAILIGVIAIIASMGNRY